MDEKSVVAMVEGETAFTVPWAFDTNRVFRFDTVLSTAGGTACVEVEMHAGQIRPTATGLRTISEWEASLCRKATADLAEGELGYVTHWKVDDDGIFRGEAVRTSPAGTSNVEVVRRGDAVVLTRAGRDTLATETADDIKPSSMADGDVGYVTEWSIRTDGSVKSVGHIQQRPHGTAVVEVRKVKGALQVTPAGLLAALNYLRACGK